MALPFCFEAKTIIAEGRTTQINVDTIKEWVQATSLPQLQDELIVIFLLSSENQIDKAKKVIEAYFRIKNGSPNIFNDINLNSNEIKSMQKVLGVCVLPNRMDNNTVVVYGKLIDTDYRHVDLIAGIKLALVHLHVIQYENPPSELVLLCDVKGIGFMHLTCFQMDVVISGLQFLQEALPLKFRAIHFLNSNYVLDKLLSLFKMFVSSDFVELVHVHSSEIILENFHKEWVPASCMPQEYGGEISFEELANKTAEDVKKMQPFLDAEEQLRSAYT